MLDGSNMRNKRLYARFRTMLETVSNHLHQIKSVPRDDEAVREFEEQRRKEEVEHNEDSDVRCKVL